MNIEQRKYLKQTRISTCPFENIFKKYTEGCKKVGKTKSKFPKANLMHAIFTEN